MATDRISESGMIKRTLLYVVAFVLGTAAFLAIASLVIMTIVKGVLPSSDKPASASASTDDAEGDTAATAQPGPGMGRPPMRMPPPRKRKPGEEDQ